MHPTRFYRRLLPLALSSLLAACGESTRTQAPHSPGTLTTRAAHQAYFRQHPVPNEPVEAVRVTDLETTLPAQGLPGQRVPGQLQAQATDKSVPIVLVHGFLGFGRDELGGVIKYWGGASDIQADLEALGYRVFTASVGPLSSNWDRSAELYAQIKGGCVDYGAAHSGTSGHDRTDAAKCYPGFYPEWDAEHPVNLIGHSQGGQTARLLVKLLEDGSAGDAEADNLYAGGRTGWVNSVMVISSPGMGTQATDNLQTLIPSLQELLFAIAASAGTAGLDPVYDFDLGHYHLGRRPGEHFSAYVERIMSSPVMTSKDASLWDISPDGTQEFNAFVGRSERVKYFSWATEATSSGAVTGWAYPNPSMERIISVLAYPYPRPLVPGLGNVFGRSRYGAVQYDSSWWANDGLVPSNHMDAPSDQVTLKYTGQTPEPGQWYALGRVEGYDHLDIIGLLTVRDVRTFYRNQAAFLSSHN